MYYTQTQIANMNIILDKVKLDTSRILDIINSDLASEEKKAMIDGVNYYNVEHDIKDRKKYYWVDGVQVEDKVSPNKKEQHPFLSILIDQSADYIVGSMPTISFEDERHEKEMEVFLNDRFFDLLNDWVKNSSKKAVEWFHVYINKRGELKTVIVPGQQVIPIWDTQYQDELTEVIRYYKYKLITESGEAVDRYKVELWTPETVTYYEQLENELFVYDSNYEINPAPHWIKTRPGSQVAESQNWGRVPFIPLKNNSEMKTDLHRIKDLIDSYDIVKSDWVNDLQSFNELLYVIKGYNPVGDNAVRGKSELRLFIDSIKQDKGVATQEGGGVDVVRSEIPVEAKERFLQMTRKEIFYFGQGIDVGDDKFGNDPSGVSLKFQYQPLDSKADAKIRKLNVALQEYFWFVTEYINRTKKTNFDPKQSSIKFNKSAIFNQKEITDMINSADISHETKLELYPFIEDVELEKERVQNERNDEIDNILNELGNESPE